jgi:hypothetical protein
MEYDVEPPKVVVERRVIELSTQLPVHATRNGNGELRWALRQQLLGLKLAVNTQVQGGLRCSGWCLWCRDRKKFPAQDRNAKLPLANYR